MHAAELLLRQKPGWDANSPFSIRAKWKALRQEFGPKEADAIWRSALFSIFEDHLENYGWRSYAGNFMSKVSKSAALRRDGVADAH